MVSGQRTHRTSRPTLDSPVQEFFIHRVSLEGCINARLQRALDHRVLDKARMLNDDSKRNGVDFVNTELDLSTTFAEKRVSFILSGVLDKAKHSALAAKTAYRAVEITARSGALQHKSKPTSREGGSGV
jgi:hypothetical protein